MVEQLTKNSLNVQS